jgi:Ser/Thr protein kinase RdoA (MazF antagonist)
VQTTHDLVAGEGTVIKTFRPRYGDEADREWVALSLLQRHAPGLAPAPLRRAGDDDSPAVVMSRLPGCPLGDRPLSPPQVTALAAALDRLHNAVPPDELVTLPPRRSGAPEMLTELRAWASQTTPALTPPVAQALRTARDWLASHEADGLAAPPADPVFTHADGNLANVLWDGTRCRIVDFEDAGVSDRAYEVADLLEHVSASLEHLVDPDELAAALRLTAAPMRRVLTARRLFATFWLLMLLPGNPGHHRNPPGSLERQAARAEALLRSP